MAYEGSFFGPQGPTFGGEQGTPLRTGVPTIDRLLDWFSRPSAQLGLALTPGVGEVTGPAEGAAAGLEATRPFSAISSLVRRGLSRGEVEGYISDEAARAAQAKAAQNILAAHAAGQGGSTYNIARGESLAGQPAYAVSIFPNAEQAAKTGRWTPSKVLEGPPTAEGIQSWLSDPKVWSLLQNPNLSAGTWENAGKTFLDVSATPRTRALGWVLGRRAGQQAMFDLSKLEEIPLPAAKNPDATRLSAIPTLEQNLATTYGRLHHFDVLKDYFEQGRGLPEWYDSTAIDRYFETPQDKDLFLKIFATLSGSRSVASNSATAEQAFALAKQGVPLSDAAWAAFPEVRRVLRTGQFYGPKTWNFYRALSGDPQAVVVDRWMARAYLPDDMLDRLTMKDGGVRIDDRLYGVLDQRIREDAGKLGVTPRLFQETVWRGIKVIREIEGASQLDLPIVDYAVRLLDRIAPSFAVTLARDWAAKGVRDMPSLIAAAGRNGIPPAIVLFAIGTGGQAWSQNTQPTNGPRPSFTPSSPGSGLPTSSAGF